jgi:glycosyltransferase involved in cell wall biosynthesis
MIDFSVIIATYNRAGYLRECLKSLVLQTHKNFETIIVDDGSIDNTENVVNEFTNLLSIIYTKTANAGYPAIPRNIAAKNASAEWLCFLDSDDKWTKNKLQTCLPLLNDYDVIYHKLKYFGNGKPFYRANIPSRQVQHPVFIDLMTIGNSIPLSGSIIRKKIFTQVNHFDEDVSIAGLEDYDLWLKVSKITDKFFFIPKALGLYRMHGNSITENSFTQINKINIVHEKYLPYLALPYHKQAAGIKDYYIAIVYERMKNYQQAIRLYKKSFKANTFKQKIKSALRIFILKIKQGFKLTLL